jgi:FkbM family methyltransferase
MASLFFLHRYPHSHVTTLEPNPHLAQLLRQNLSPWHDRSHVIEAALSSRDGKTTFHVTRDNLLNVTGGIENRESSDRRVVRFDVDTVDAGRVLKDPVDLMKLDVEGHEYEILHLELFRPSHVKNLIVEFHDIDAPGSRFLDTMRLLTDQRGYRVANADGIRMTADELPTLSGCSVLKLF